MKAIILAAGIGKRLYPLTKERPKCMLDVGGKPILEYILESINFAGISEAVIVVGPQKEMIEKKFGKKFGNVKLTYVYNELYQSTNNLRSLWCAREQLTDEFIQIHGDLVLNKEIVKLACSSKVKNGVLITKDHIHFVVDGNRVLLDGDIISDINKTSSWDYSEGRAFGIYKFSKLAASAYRDIIDSEKNNFKDGFEKALLPMLKKFEFKVIDINKLSFSEIDDLNDLNEANKKVKTII